MRSRVLVAAAAVVAALVGAQTAFAAQLQLAPPRLPHVTTVARCATATVTVKPVTSTTVTVTGIPAGCVGRPVQVWLGYGTNSTVAGSTTAAGGSATVTLPSFTAAAIDGVHVRLDGWPVTAIWGYTTIPVLPLVSCTPSDGIGTCTTSWSQQTSWGEGGGTRFHWILNVTTTSTTPVNWTVTFNFSDPASPYYPTWVNEDAGGSSQLVSASCGPPRTVTVKGNSSWGFGAVTASSPRQVHIQGGTAGTTPTAGTSLLSCPAGFTLPLEELQTPSGSDDLSADEDDDSAPPVAEPSTTPEVVPSDIAPDPESDVAGGDGGASSSPGPEPESDPGPVFEDQVPPEPESDPALEDGRSDEVEEALFASSLDSP